MSGFLYGKRNQVIDDMKFYKKNFLKILIDYYLVIIIVILLFIIFFPEQLSIITIINVFLTYGTINGGEHLWYIPYCLFCYLITPFLSRYFDNFKNKNVIIRFLLFSIIMGVIVEKFFGYFNFAWIFCYILGFFLGTILINKKDKLYNTVCFGIILIGIFFNAVQVIQDYLLQLELNNVVSLMYLKFCDYAHVFLGISLFIIFKKIFGSVFINGYPNFIKKLCFYSDKYSYDIYLVHQFVILGPFSMMNFTKLVGVNLGLIMIVIVISAFFINYVATFIRNKVKLIG